MALVKQGMGASLVPSSLSSSVFSDVAFLEIEERQAEHDVAQIWRSDDTSPTFQNFLLGLPRFEARL